MINQKLKSTILRVLLCLHFIGLAATLGGRFAVGVTEERTVQSSVTALVLGHEVINLTQRQIIVPGFLLLVVTGIAMTLLRYGRKPPIWVWLKTGLIGIMLAVAVGAVRPVVDQVNRWVEYSAAHGQIAPELAACLDRSHLLGNIVRVLFFSIIAVSVWKPVTLRLFRKPALASQALVAK